MTEEETAVPFPPPMRASNQDREQVASALQKAMSEGRITVAELENRLDSVYAAKTVAELEPITLDLPGHGLSLTKPAAPLVRSAPRVQGTSSVPELSLSGSPTAKANLVGILSGVERKGEWVAPAQINCVAIMGGINLDFTRAQLSSMETVINVTAIMGGVEITVPEGITVIVQGVGIMGAFVDSAHQSHGQGAPLFRVKGLALMGGVEVKSSHRAVGS